MNTRTRKKTLKRFKEKTRYKPVMVENAKKMVYVTSALMFIAGMIMTIFNYTSTSDMVGVRKTTISGPGIMFIAVVISSYTWYLFRKHQ